MPVRFRAPVGIFEAALLLVLAGMGLWIWRPIPGARSAAAEETNAKLVLAALADAEDALAAGKRGVPCLRLDRLAAASPAAAKALAGWSPARVPGVYGNRSYWITVVLPGHEGWLARPGTEEAGEASRGYAIVAWPSEGAPAVLRALAALPEQAMWQRADRMEESGDPAAPPVPRVAFPPAGQGPRAPAPPFDWALSRREGRR